MTFAVGLSLYTLFVAWIAFMVGCKCGFEPGRWWERRELRSLAISRASNSETTPLLRGLSGSEVEALYGLAPELAAADGVGFYETSAGNHAGGTAA